ncbi:ammonium transporter [Xylanimonas protaetiae]|uniref:Ammonium transporter n=1 Tax=Xylanimonas protaetiae TaxID=2509457 RepID=A0A4P6FAU0_9MICO|nr:ammonium transporter [Xylanimonas protaetiae]QAY70537.1 ammonium transporter [Xylanimonas protaetiae]
MDFTLDTGNTAWLLTSASLVLLMTPALAFFYGGMVRGKSVLNMLMMSFTAMGIGGLVWALWGYSLAFGPNIAGGLLGNPGTFFGLAIDDADGPTASFGIPALVFVAFQATFAIITVALISGAIADRVKIGTWMVFAAVWVTVVYAPLAHWVWGGGMFGADGWLAKALSLPIDFAGGTVVHINAGAAGLALALLTGRRKGFGKEPMRPHNLPFVMLGAGMLWFGWFGFNAGSELAADGTAGRAWVNTLVATAVAMLAWLGTERLRDGHATSLGAASGVVAGLVAITPAAGTVTTWGAIAVGAAAGILCALAVGLKYKLGFDDSLDVVGVHLVGGLVGTILIGLFATNGVYNSFYFEGSQDGLFYGGGVTQLLTQVVVALIAVVWSFVLTYAIGWVLKVTLGWRVPEEHEVGGIDLAQHGETAYETATQGTVFNRENKEIRA